MDSFTPRPLYPREHALPIAWVAEHVDVLERITVLFLPGFEPRIIEPVV
jgi:hypothetical protein